MTAKAHIETSLALVRDELKRHSPLDMPNSTWNLLVSLEARLETALDHLDEPRRLGMRAPVRGDAA
jgi:hypothetical protein